MGSTKFPTTTEINVLQKVPMVVSFSIQYDAANATFTVPVKAGTTVHSVRTRVSNTFDGTGVALTIGDGDDPDGYLDATDIALATKATATTPAIIKSENGSNPYANGKQYDVDDTIDFFWTQCTSGTPTTGLLHGQVFFTQMKNDGIEVS